MRDTRAALVAVLFIAIGGVWVSSIPGARAQFVGGGSVSGGGGGSAFNGGTITQGITISGVTTDLTAASGEDLRLQGGAVSGSVVLRSIDDDVDLEDSAGDVIGKVDVDAANNTFMIANNGAAGGAVVFRSQVAYIGTKAAAGTTDPVACIAESITDDDGSCHITVQGDGKMLGAQVTTGTPATWRVPTAIANDTITHPTCSTSADAGKLVFIDDSNDAAAGVLCVCRAGTDNTTYALVQVADNSTACIDP